MGLIMANTQMVQLDLRLCPRQRDDTLKRHGVMVFVGQRQGLIARCRDQCGKCDASSGTRSEPDSAPEADDRIKHSTDGVGKREAINDRHWCADPTPATKKPGAV